MTPENLANVDDYLNITSRLKRETLHFFFLDSAHWNSRSNKLTMSCLISLSVCLDKVVFAQQTQERCCCPQSLSL